MTEPLLPGTASEPGGWARLGNRRSGRVMRSLGFMRVERTVGGWRAWDVVVTAELLEGERPHYETKILPSLAKAKAYCEACVADAEGTR